MLHARGLSEGVLVGRIFLSPYGYHEDRTPTHGYEPTRELPWRHSPRAGGGSKAPPYY